MLLLLPFFFILLYVDCWHSINFFYLHYFPLFNIKKQQPHSSFSSMSFDPSIMTGFHIYPILNTAELICSSFALNSLSSTSSFSTIIIPFYFPSHLLFLFLLLYKVDITTSKISFIIFRTFPLYIIFSNPFPKKEHLFIHSLHSLF